MNGWEFLDRHMVKGDPLVDLLVGLGFVLFVVAFGVVMHGLPFTSALVSNRTIHEAPAPAREKAANENPKDEAASA